MKINDELIVNFGKNLITKRKLLKAIAIMPLFTITKPLTSRANSYNQKSFLTTKSNNNQNNNKMTIQLPALPYARNALSPHISENTLNYHYGKHHQAYVNNLNNLIKDSELEGKSLEDIIKISYSDKKTAIFNNAAQVWNHTFYWHSMKPNGGGKPNGKIADKINQDFGSFDNFVTEFKNAATTQFGSGWAWLIIEDNKLKITKTGNADTPITNPNSKTIITIDVWEHAYYLDFQNARPNYIDIFLNHLVNWDFANQNLVS